MACQCCAEKNDSTLCEVCAANLEMAPSSDAPTDSAKLLRDLAHVFGVVEPTPVRLDIALTCPLCGCSPCPAETRPSQGSRLHGRCGQCLVRFELSILE